MLDLVTCTLGPSGFSTPKVQFSLLQVGTGQSAGTLSGQITIPCLLGLAGSFLISRNCCVSLTLGYPHPCGSWDALLSAWSSSLRLGKAILVSNTRGRGAQTHSFSPRSGPSSPRAWTGSPEVRNPSRTTPPNTEARNRWPPQIRAGGSLVRPLTVCGRDELRGLSFCHRLFLVRCGTRPAEAAVHGVLQETGRRLQIRTCNRKLGSRQERRRLAQEANQPAQPSSQVSHKPPAREGSWGCWGAWGAAGKTSDLHRCFCFLHCKGSAGCWDPRAPRNWRAPPFFAKSRALLLLSGRGCIGR